MTGRVRVLVDRHECFSFGVCVETLPTVFVHDNEGKPVIQPVAQEAIPLDLLKEAVEGCPRGALTLVDEEGRIVWS